MSPWVSAAIGLTALLIQALLGFFFLGKMRSEVNAVRADVEKVEGQILRMEAAAQTIIAASTESRVRVDRLELDAGAVDKMVRDLAEFKGAQQVHNQNWNASFDRVVRELSGVQRQLGNLVAMKRAGTSFEQAGVD